MVIIGQRLIVMSNRTACTSPKVASLLRRSPINAGMVTQSVVSMNDVK